MTGKIMPLRERDTSMIQAAADAFLSSPRYANPNTRRGYTGVLDRLLAGLGASRPLAEVSGEELAGLLDQLWGRRAPATWNRNRGAVAAWLSWCAASRLPAPVLPASAERRREHLNATRAIPRPTIDRALTRRDLPLREKTLWRMLYETAARASEVLALNIEDLDLDARRSGRRIGVSAQIARNRYYTRPTGRLTPIMSLNWDGMVTTFPGSVPVLSEPPRSSRRWPGAEVFRVGEEVP